MFTFACIAGGLISEEEQRFTFEKNLPMFARILTHTEFLSDLGL